MDAHEMSGNSAAEAQLHTLWTELSQHMDALGALYPQLPEDDDHDPSPELLATVREHAQAVRDLGDRMLALSPVPGIDPKTGEWCGVSQTERAAAVAWFKRFIRDMDTSMLVAPKAQPDWHQEDLDGIDLGIVSQVTGYFVRGAEATLDSVLEGWGGRG